MPAAPVPAPVAAWYRGGVESVPSSGPVLRALSPREREVVDLVVRGMTRRAIGRQLGISPATVGGHVMTACLKLRLSGGGRALTAWLTARAN